MDQWELLPMSAAMSAVTCDYHGQGFSHRFSVLRKEEKAHLLTYNVTVTQNSKLQLLNMLRCLTEAPGENKFSFLFIVQENGSIDLTMAIK